MWWLDDLLRAQFGRPAGAFGALVVGPSLNLASVPLVNAALDALHPAQGDRLLDIGFGPGYSVLAASRRVRDVVGVDYSWDMVASTARLVRRIRGARLCCGDVMHLPFADGSFDGALSANSIYYWPDPVAGLREIRRVLRVHGRAVIAVRSPWRLRALTWTWQGFRLYEADEIAALMKAAGFHHIITQHRDRFLPLDSLLIMGRAAPVGRQFGRGESRI